MIEQTLILLKPDAIGRNLIGEIIKRYEAGGLKVAKIEGPFMAEDKVVRDHYQIDNYDYVITLGHVDVSEMSEEEKKERYKRMHKVVEDLHRMIMSGPIIKMLLEGENAIEQAREITGKSDPGKSDKGTVRGDLGDDSFVFSDKEQRAVRNLVHASDKESVEREIKLWFGTD